MKLLESLSLFPDTLIRDNIYFQIGSYELDKKRFYIGHFKIMITRFGLILTKRNLNIFIMNYPERGLIISTRKNGKIHQTRSKMRRLVDDLNRWMIFLIEYDENEDIEKKINNLLL